MTGRYALRFIIGVPAFCSSWNTWPRFWDRVPYTPDTAWLGTWISHRKMGSQMAGSDMSTAAYMQRRAVGMIWPAPRWMASACRVTSASLKAMPRMDSSHTGPAEVATMKPARTWSLTSFRYCTARVTSTSRLVGVSPTSCGPKAQILRAWSTSQPKSSAILRPRSLASCVGMMSPASMAAISSEDRGSAYMYRRLCLLGDLDSAWSLSLEPVTDSR
mmetsp:Transcript_20616/g.66124  ORF Transcript_20616/g.66124 Transcript_20616/m.66124 type:complete len:217 (-) Transcript_20616:1899-2549(-)